MSTISLCMIVKDEEDVLARCLDSVKDVVDEIVVLDTGSRDATREIARRYTANVYDFTWVDDFAAARNASFDKATKDYVMWLDADDVILEADRTALLELKAQLNPSIHMVMMKYNVAFDEQGNPSVSYYRERLMLRSRKYRWVSPIHEVIPPSGTVIYSSVAVTHNKLHPSDPDRNLRIFEGMRARGLTFDPRQQFYYGRELYYHHRYQEAMEVLRRFLDSGDGWVENNISACLDLASCHTALGEREAALSALYRSFRYDVPRAEALCAVGNWFFEEGSYEAAAFWYQCAARSTPKDTGGFTSPDCYGFLPYIQLCVCYDKLGDRKTAEKYHRKAKRLKPENPAVLRNDAYFKSLHAAQKKQ